MKTIEQGSKEVIGNQGKRAFIKGVEFAQRWIPVEEELPEDNEILLRPYEDDFTTMQTIKILVKTDCDSIIDNFRLKMQVGNKEWVWFMNLEDEQITHWRQIELK